MLNITALSTAAINATCTAALVFSPSKHPFMKRVVAMPTRFSFDPYKTVRAQLMMNNASTMCMNVAKVAVTATAAPAITSSTALFPVPTPSVVVAAPKVAATATAAPSSNAPRYVVIAFKHTTATFRAPFRVAEGDVVIVEGDRGEHIGTVKSVLPTNDETSQKVAAMTVAPCKIIRRATATDVAVSNSKGEKEAAVLIDITKAAKEVRLNATIADCEFQLDSNKLTIFVERATSSTFVDFRKVQRTLFKMFHCRIWFIYMDEVSTN